jgi:hypothetical protein
MQEGGVVMWQEVKTEGEIGCEGAERVVGRENNAL